MTFLIVIASVLYSIRVVFCMIMLFTEPKYELEDLGVRSMTDAVMFAFMPFFLFYLGFMHLKEKFENQ